LFQTCHNTTAWNKHSTNVSTWATMLQLVCRSVITLFIQGWWRQQTCYKTDRNLLPSTCLIKTYKLVAINLYKLAAINLLKACYVQTMSDLLEQLVASLLTSSALLQDDNNFVPDLSTTGNKQCEQILLISCEIFTIRPFRQSLNRVSLSNMWRTMQYLFSVEILSWFIMARIESKRLIRCPMTKYAF
jgi:hypothetical protein